MTSRPLIDPEVAPLINLLPPLELNDASIGPIREMLGAPNPDLPPPPFEPQRRYAPGLDGGPDVPVLVFDPPHRAGSGAILHIHGGGMVMGTAAISNLSNAALALALGVPIVSVDYRLAPENPFPGPRWIALPLTTGWSPTRGNWAPTRPGSSCRAKARAVAWRRRWR